ncbi:MAG: mandelate racemase/muconate lactonizing enzyme family protein, partial [Burkholderiales bacterium]
MKITRVEPILVRTPLKLDDAQPQAGGLPKNDVHTVLVKVETDEGVTGWGEAFSNAGWQSTVTAIAQIIAPRVVGRDASQIAQIQADLHRGLYNTGRSGPTVFAISGLDIALWDIAAKRAGLPLYKMLGGSARETLPAYASLLRYGDARVVERKTKEAIDRGYRYIKLHENKTDIVRAARKVCGDKVPLMVDCSCPWTVDEAIAVAHEWSDMKLAWIEEPIYP